MRLPLVMREGYSGILLLKRKIPVFLTIKKCEVTVTSLDGRLLIKLECDGDHLRNLGDQAVRQGFPNTLERTFLYEYNLL